MIPTLEGSLDRDGRRITFSVAGPRDGIPVVYLHGGAGTPIRCAPGLPEVISRLGIRHVAINRPGFGGSDRAVGRSVTSFVEDLRAVADELGLERFVLVGISSGGPYALAAGRAMPERIAALGVVSCISPGTAPHQSQGLGLSMRLVLEKLGCHPHRAERAVGMLLRTARGRRRLRRAARVAVMLSGRHGRRQPPFSLEDPLEALVGAAKTGIRSMAEDYALVCGPWGFRLDEVTLPVHLWHGAGDGFVPLEQARALAQALPNCQARIGTDDGHFFYRRRMADVLSVLVAEARAGEAARQAEIVRLDAEARAGVASELALAA